MKTFSKVEPILLAKVHSVFFAFIGFISACVYALGGFIYDYTSNEGLNFGTLLAFFAILGMPLIFALFGIIFGYLEGWFFNRLIKLFLNFTKNNF